MGGDHLAEAAAHLLCALELREQRAVSAECLRERVNERRAR
jgi:hypothetical protein